MTAFTEIPDRSVGYALAETDWDDIKVAFNESVVVLLASSTLSATTASFDLTSISGSWTHLMLLAYVRSNSANSLDNAWLRFNNDSGSNYDYEYVRDVGGLNASEGLAQSKLIVGDTEGGNAPANKFSAIEVYIPNYSNATNHKVALARASGQAAGPDPVTHTSAGFWRSTSAITRVTLLPSSGSWVAGSNVSLFGLP
jgi:hypothetical protein